METVLTNPGGIVRSISGVTTVGAGITARPLANKRWILLGLTSQMTASATVGNRNYVIRMSLDAAAYQWYGAASGNVAATQICGYDIAFGSPLNTPSTTVRRNFANTANVNVMVRENCPFVQLDYVSGSGYLGAVDANAVDAADVWTYNLQVLEFDV